MKPLIIAVDVVGYSLSHDAELRAHMQQFLDLVDAATQKGGRHGDDFFFLPTGDGALLICRFDDQSSSEDARSFLFAFLERIHEWMTKTDRKLRIGLHTDSSVYELMVSGRRNCFGEGVNDCVRIMGAADPGQILISKAAHQHLFAGNRTSAFEFGESFSLFDKHGIRYQSLPLGLLGSGHALGTPKAATEFSARIALGARAEREGSYSKVTQARFVAMTFHTLGTVMSNAAGSPIYPELKRAELWIYALPILRFCHPLHSGSGVRLENEWIRGLTRTLEGFVDNIRCPKLEELEVCVISSEPTITSSFLVHQHPQGEFQELRVTHVIDGQEPNETPTVHLQVTSGETTPIFATYEKIIEALGHRRAPLRFPVKCIDGTRKYTRVRIPKFVEALTSCCNHSQYAIHDRSFCAQWRDPRTDAGDSGELSTLDVPGLIRRSAARLRADVNVLDGVVTLSPDDAPEGESLLCGVKDSHIVAAFALLLTVNHQEIVLVRNTKPVWELDVPGGKVSDIDQSLEQTVVRELFEELGLQIDPVRLSKPLAYKYDAMSAKESQGPVIAVYYGYQLVRSEESYLFEITKRSTKALRSTPNDSLLEKYRIDKLLTDKANWRKTHPAIEGVCHAPAEAIAALRQALRRQQS